MFSQLSTDHIWQIVGVIGVALFGSRFLVQWIASEKKKQSVVPVSFWYLSLGGCLFQLVYFLHKMEWVGVAGQILLPIVYLRNLVLIHRQRRLETAPGSPTE